MKILITGGKSALALKILKAFTQHEVILADYGEVPSFSGINYKFTSLGERNDDTIAHTILNSCLDQEVDVILPICEFEIEPLNKAKVLFNEFNIAMLLPDRDLDTYFQPHALTKYAEWIVFNDGEVLFTTSTVSELTIFGKQEHLNGVFYFIKDKPVANLRLITI